VNANDSSKDLVVGTDGEKYPARFADPGLPEHRDRLADRDPAAAKRAERQVAVLFGLSALGTIGFLLAYFLVPPGQSVSSIRLSNLLLGLSLSLGMLGVGLGAVHWAKTLMSDHERVEERHPQRSSDADRAGAIAALKAGAADSGVGVGRRGLLKGALIGAIGLLPLSIAVPLIGNVGGDWDTNKFRHTIWRAGRRLARDPSGTAIKATDVTIGSVFHVIPEGLEAEAHPLEEKAKAVVVLIRLDPRDLNEAPEKKSWSYYGIVAYSKICTHVGCPVALYEQQTHHLVCPCHQSTFDVSNGAKVVFGPARRPLPQLPIAVDAEGYLVAQSDFHEPIGPSYWERLK